MIKNAMTATKLGMTSASGMNWQATTVSSSGAKMCGAGSARAYRCTVPPTQRPPTIGHPTRCQSLLRHQRLGRDINIRPSCKGESDDRWWGHEEAIIQIGVHAAGEVAIAGQHCHGRAFLLGNLRSQRA